MISKMQAIKRRGGDQSATVDRGHSVYNLTGTDQLLLSLVAFINTLLYLGSVVSVTRGIGRTATNSLLRLHDSTARGWELLGRLIHRLRFRLWFEGSSPGSTEVTL